MRSSRNESSVGEWFSRPPPISLPKGGGAIRGIGEKFAANPVSGTGSLSVPIYTSPGRSGFEPKLALSYDSGAGNGLFGFGWSLSLPAITRSTAKGLPRYLDDEESDIFMLAGAEDLVPEYHADGTRLADTTTDPDHVIHRYRPRVEGLFARLERWTRRSDGDVHWRSISKDNVLALYGKDGGSRISDPDRDGRVFSWLICEMRDAKGNAIVYDYKAEDATGVDLLRSDESNRGDRDSKLRKANRHIKRVRYGNRHSLLIDGRRPRFLTDATIAQADWLFEVVFDYGEHHADNPAPGDAGAWICRNDPFSTCRAGFEIRTYRLCQRVLMFHHFAGEPDVEADCLVRSMDFVYRDCRDDPRDRTRGHPIASFISAIVQCGYRRTGAEGYLKRTFPPLELGYSKAVLGHEIRDVDTGSLENLPAGVDGSAYSWLDLDGEGLSGALAKHAGGWLYKRNLSPLVTDGEGRVAPRLGPVEQVSRFPAGGGAAGDRRQFLDLAGDGQVDLVAFDKPVAGFYERTDAEDWEPFRAFRHVPNLAWDDPALKFIDLTGDGRADLLIARDEIFTWYPSLGEQGFDAARSISMPADEERAPRVLVADDAETILQADMSGDGLTDIVRIRDGEVSYWPNLGYGRFGARVVMEGSPWFDVPDQFDPRRIRLVDIDGTGATDIVYLGRGETRFWFNQSGNGWSDANELAGFPPFDNVSSVAATDLLGNGTACLVWSSPLPGAGSMPMKYLALMAEGKPHLLVRVTNNLGAETCIHYEPSTYFYVRDRQAGRPWVSKLPFPVHVVERVETYDHISRNRYITRYAYHHGYFDGVEREFHGFAMVEQWDTELLAALTATGEFPVGRNADAASHSPPVYTRTWYHTGVYLGGKDVAAVFKGLLDPQDRGEYYREPGWLDEDHEAARRFLDDSDLPRGLTAEEERQACRALKGAMLRQEVYGLDGKSTNDYPYGHPYIVTERSFSVRLLQRRFAESYAVFVTHDRETLTYQYDRNPADPRITHMLTLAVDDYGNVLRSVTVNYGRRDSPQRRPEQDETHLVLTLNRFATRDDQADWRHIGLPAEVSTHEVVKPPATLLRFSWDELHDLFEALAPSGQLPSSGSMTVPYEQWDWRQRWNPLVEPGGLVGGAPVHTRLRLIENIRTLYRPDDFGDAEDSPLALLPLGEVGSLALPGESYKRAFTPGLLAEVLRRPLDALQPPGSSPAENLLPDAAAVLRGGGADRGGYVELDGDGCWWVPSGRVFLSPSGADTPGTERIFAFDHFFLPHRHRDPFHTDAASTEGVVTYDDYHLLLVETRDAAGNRVTVGERDQDGRLVRHGNDYRVLQPALVMDANRNRTAVAFDALGMVVATALMGKPSAASAEGDSLDDVAADLAEETMLLHLANPLGDPQAILGSATTRLVHDLFAYHRTKHLPRPEPAVIYSLARETHVADLRDGRPGKIQHSFSYSDGFGREIQHKIQAEPGPLPKRDGEGTIILGADGQPEMTSVDVSPRWVGNGWTVLNNKGKPVREYEPFFTDRHGFEFDIRIGVSPVRFYDPVQRAVATLHPDHTWEKVIFSPWRQETWDVNDTVLVADPATDPDVGVFFSSLAKHEYSPTWHALRTDPAHAEMANAQWPDRRMLDAVKRVAEDASVHAATPAVAEIDPLGRTFLTVAHNRYKYGDSPLTEEFHHKRIVFDIEGSQREAIDANDRIVARSHYDMLGNLIHEASMEAGENWTLLDVTGKAIRIWDSRGHGFRHEYDLLRRPLRTRVVGVDLTDRDRVLLIERLVYGEQHPQSEARNLRGRLFLHLDQAGALFSEAYDFKGNRLRAGRGIGREYKVATDWEGIESVLPLEVTATFNEVALRDALSRDLEPDIFMSGTAYDALNRTIQSIAPHANGLGVSTIQPEYNEANLLERMHVWFGGAAEPENLLDREAADLAAVETIAYDAKGRRTLIDYGNGVRTTCSYDRLTSRLVRLTTRRKEDDFPDDCPSSSLQEWPGCGVQDLHYVHDPIGNISHIRDDTQQAVYFRNCRIDPDASYVYDSVYRLIEATGREHLGQVGGSTIPHSFSDARRVGFLHPSDGCAMGRYLERYVYDAVGCMLAMQHRGSDASQPWTRSFVHDERSQIQTDKRSNRPTSSSVGLKAETYSVGGDGYDAHGNMQRMPHLQIIQWDCRNQICMTSRQAVNENAIDEIERQGERTWYVYDAGGQRVRKVTESSTGQIKDERIYLGGVELYRRHGRNPLQRETLHIMDDKRRIALVETRIEGDDGSPHRVIRFQFANHLGTAVLELDHLAHIISYEEYSPFGSTTFQALSGGIRSKRYRYTGKERDEESGLYYHGARYYAPWLAGWTSCDPSGLRDGPQLYCYVQNNPVRLNDPTGMYGLGDFGNDLGRVNRALSLITPGAAAAQAVSSTIGKVAEAVSGKSMPVDASGSKPLSGSERVEAATDVLISVTPAAPLHSISKAVGHSVGQAIKGKITKGQAAVNIAKAEPSGVVAKVFETAEALDHAEVSSRSGSSGETARAYIDAGLSFVELVQAGVGLAEGARGAGGKGNGSAKTPAGGRGGGAGGGGKGGATGGGKGPPSPALPRMSDPAMLQHVTTNVFADAMVDAAAIPGDYEAFQARNRLMRAQFGNLMQDRVGEAVAGNPATQNDYLRIYQQAGVSVPDFLHTGNGSGRPFIELTTMRRETVLDHATRWYAPYSDLVLYPSLPGSIRQQALRLQQWRASRGS